MRQISVLATARHSMCALSTLSVLVALSLSSCGKKQETATKAPAASAKPAASAAKPKPKPKPPELGIEVATFSKARLIEACALKHGESKEDALTLAINSLAGIQHVAPPGPQPSEVQGREKTPTKNGVPIPKTDGPDLDMKAKDQSQGDHKDADGAHKTTPAGRSALTSDVRPLVDKYKKALKVLPKRPDVSGPLDKQVEACRWSPRLGLIEEELVTRYIEAFVQISCLQISMTDKKGRLDALKHAQEATKIFKKYGFSAPQFAQLGLALGAFPDVTASLHQQRRKRCDDPVELAQQKRQSGAFVGSVRGKLSGSVTFDAGKGAASGLLMHGKGALKGAEPWPLKGSMSPERVHLFGRSKSDWIRMEATVSNGVGKGAWKAEVDAKQLSGTWRFSRKPAPKKTATKAGANGEK